MTVPPCSSISDFPVSQQCNLSELRYWLTLWQTPGIGSVSFAKIYSLFPQLADFFALSDPQYRALGLSAESIAFIKASPWQGVEKMLQWAENPNRHILTWQSPLYPPLLKETVGAPPVLSVWGDPRVLKQAQVAIVGSRNPSPSGTTNARNFAADLCALGLVVTSGLAVGIDSAAHQATLAHSGKTIAVLGSGLERIYPIRHKTLAAEIAEHGAVISELPLDLGPKPENFPQRNRIVSGLSLGVLVVEATLRSGSLITARLAAEQGREVFAIPGSIQNPLSRGCHALIGQGAKLVEAVEDIWLEIAPAMAGHLAAKKIKKSPTTKKNSIRCSGNFKHKVIPQGSRVNNLLDANYSQLLECVGYEITAIDLLAERTGFSMQNIAEMLLMLELEGYIALVSGGYVRCY